MAESRSRSRSRERDRDRRRSHSRSRLRSKSRDRSRERNRTPARNRGVRNFRKKSLLVLTEKIETILLPKRRARQGVESGNVASLERKILGLLEGMGAASKRRQRERLGVEADHLRRLGRLVIAGRGAKFLLTFKSYGVAKLLVI